MSAAPAPSVAIVGLGFGRAHVPAFQAVGARHAAARRTWVEVPTVSA